MHYVIGDVHGCFDELQLLLSKIETMDPDARFIFVGDFIDRGPKVWETVNWAMKNVKNDPEAKYRSVLGNHEDMAVEWMKSYVNRLNWNKTHSGQRERFTDFPKYHYDFDSVLEKYIPEWKKRGGYFEESDFLPFRTFFQNLPDCIDLNVTTKWGKEISFKIVHSWDNPYEERPFVIKDNHIWERSYTGWVGNGILVHGHTPTALPEYYYSGESCTRPGMISYRHRDVNLDGGCVFYNLKYSELPCMLGAICLETLDEIYPWTLKERFLMQTGDVRAKITPNGLFKKYEKTYPSIEDCRFRREMLILMGNIKK